MKTILRISAVALTLCLPAALAAQVNSSTGAILARIPVLLPAAESAAYSVELPVVARTGGIATDTVLLLNPGHRFDITVIGRDPRTGAVGEGRALFQNDVFGYFSLPALTGNPANPEVFVKIVDGTAWNGFFWVFYGGLTDLEFTLTVSEPSTGRARSYTKPGGSRCGDFDMAAFPAADSGTPHSPARPEELTLIETPGLRTSVDFVNNTIKNGVIASYQFSYTCLSAKCSPPGGFYRTTVQSIVLPALGAFHQDDFVDYLSNLGLLQPGAAEGALGTLLVTFFNLDSATGWEANVIGNTYSPLVENDPLQGTVGFSYNASLFFDSADTTLMGYARNTTASPTVAGKLRSDLAVRNTDIHGTNLNAKVDFSFYDTVSGQHVGNNVTLLDVKPGEIREIVDVWAAAAIPPSITSVIVFADISTPGFNPPTMEGFVLWKDTQKSQSPRFLTMLCADLNGCGN